jgi:hypothetical protein
MKIYVRTLCAFVAGMAFSGPETAVGQVVISGYMANTPGDDSPFEYVQLKATENINFASTPYSVVFANNGTATASGWTAGGSVTYGFNLTAGTVAIGDVFYVGGSARLLNGSGSTSMASLTWIRTINTGATAGDGFGNGASGGVLGNGGSNADGFAVFSGLASSLTSSSVPIDGLFFGTATGTAVVSGGSAGYELPVNDRYSGGKLQSTSFLFGDPASGGYTKLTGTYNTLTATWDTVRSGSTVTSPTALSQIDSAITLVPEPQTYASIAGAALVGFGLWRRARQA